MKGSKIKKNILIFAKKKYGLDKVISYLKKRFETVDFYIGKLGDPFPSQAFHNEYDVCISYMSPWVIPRNKLIQVKEFSINFHPGPPEYRGIGCTNFALYNQEQEYGVTAHLMAPKIDAGKIINVRRFPILAQDTLVSLTRTCYKNILEQFYQVFDYYVKHGKLPAANASWASKLYIRDELDALCKIDIDMDINEVSRRVKATDFPNMPKAYILVHGHKFEFKEKLI